MGFRSLRKVSILLKYSSGNLLITVALAQPELCLLLGSIVLDFFPDSFICQFYTDSSNPCYLPDMVIGLKVRTFSK